METCRIENLYNLDETIAKRLFEGATYPWELLPKIGSFILELGKTLSEEEYEKRGEDVWVAKSASVAPTFMDRLLSAKMLRYATVLLFGEMPWWGRGLW